MPAPRVGSARSDRAPLSSSIQPGTVGAWRRSFAGTGKALAMTEEIDKTEARQGDHRRTTQTVLLIGTPLAFIALGILYLIWA